MGQDISLLVPSRPPYTPRGQCACSLRASCLSERHRHWPHTNTHPPASPGDTWPAPPPAPKEDPPSPATARKAGSLHGDGAALGCNTAETTIAHRSRSWGCKGDRSRKAQGFNWFDMAHRARRVLHENDHRQAPGTRSSLMATCPTVPKALASCRGASSIFQNLGYAHAP